MKEAVLTILIIASLLITGCTQDLIIKQTTNNIEDNCPNEENTHCIYIVTENMATANITIWAENNSEINITIEEY